MDLKSTFEAVYPTGSVGGECGDFAHLLVEFPRVGNSYREKQAAVNRYGTRHSLLRPDDFRPGDVLITSEGTWFGFGPGHVAVVNFANDVSLFLTESNFKKTGRVTHTRVLPKNSPKIYGIIRGRLKVDVAVEFPIRIKTAFLLNRQAWPDFTARVTNVCAWFNTASKGRIELDPYPVITNISGWEYRVNPDVSEAKMIDPEFYKSHIQPLAGDAKAFVFIVANREWDGAATGGKQLQGYCDQFSDVPIRTVVATDAGELSGHFFGVDAFFDYARHELMHGLYRIGQPSRFDFVHKHFYEEKNPEACFDDFDYKLLSERLRL